MASLYLVDDHVVVRHGLRALLVEAGHAVLGDSGDPDVALADLQRLQPDVALIDLSLGERSGLELLAAIQTFALPVRSIVLTMSAQPRHVGNAMRLGASGYVLKGSPSDELLSAIGAVALGRRHFGAGVAELAMQALSEPNISDPFVRLSARERQVVVMVVNGHTSAEIGVVLRVSPKTVDSYRSRLMAKLNTGDLTGLVKLALRHGLITDDAA